MGVLFGITFAHSEDLAVASHFHHEGFVVFRAFFAHGHIVRRALIAGLHIFLQDAFVVHQFVAGNRGFVIHQNVIFYKSGSCSNAAIQVDGADHGFHGIGEDGGLAGTAGAHFFRAEQDVLAQLDGIGFEGEIGLGDYLGLQLGELAFLFVRMLGKELFAHDETQDGISQKFHALKG